MKTDIVIVGTGVSGLYCALNLPRDKKIVMVTKADDERFVFGTGRNMRFERRKRL